MSDIIANIESILEGMETEGSDPKDRVDLLNQLALELSRCDTGKALSVIEEAVKISKKNKYTSGLALAIRHRARVNFTLGNIEAARNELLFCVDAFAKLGDLISQASCHRILGRIEMAEYKYSDAINLYEKSIALFKEVGDKAGEAETIYLAAESFREMGDYSNAINGLARSLEIFRDIGDKLSESKVLTSIGNINLYMAEADEALGYYKKGYALREEVIASPDSKLFPYQLKEVSTNQSIALMNIGNAYNELGDYDNALDYYMRSLKLKRELGNKKEEGRCFINIAVMNTKLKKYDIAEKDLNTSLKIQREVNDRVGETASLENLAYIYLKRGQYKDAVNFFKDALKLADEVNDKVYRYEINKGLSDCYGELGDYEQAYKHFKDYHEIRNEVFNEESYSKIKNLQYKYEIENAKKEAEFEKHKSVELKEALGKVEELNENLKNMNEEKNTFMAMVAHDLKNPLNAIFGYSQLVKANIEQFSTEELNEMFGDIEISASNMNELITNYLEFTAIETGKIDFRIEEIHVPLVASQVVTSFIRRAESKGIKIHRDIEEDTKKVKADRNALIQILENLVSNAIKFSPRKSAVYVSVLTAEDKIRCVIRDEGPGISDEDKENLFKKFSKLSARPTAGENSTGLGLSITKRLAEAMKGNVYCDSTLGEGASFIVEFPVIESKKSK